LIGFFDDVAVRTFHVAPQTNEENAYFTAEFRYDEQVGEFAQFQLDFLNTLTLNVCWVSSIVVSGEGAAVTVPNGSDLQMIATVLPTSATDATVVWSVVNGTGTATIDANGLLSGTGIGTVTVIATANDAGAVSGSIEIEVV
jgi:hypothetical protein